MQTNYNNLERFTRTGKSTRTNKAALLTKVHNKKDLTLERKNARNNKRKLWEVE